MADFLQSEASARQIVPERGKYMKQMGHFETAPTGGQRQAMADLLTALYRDVRLLDVSIEAELAIAGYGGSSPAVPIAVRTMSVRRENLKATIAILEQRLSFVTPAIAAAKRQRVKGAPHGRPTASA